MPRRVALATLRVLVLLAVTVFGGLGREPAPRTAVAAAPARHASSSPGTQQSTSRAGIVIRYADDNVETRCVSFGGQAITAEELLLTSGLSAELSPEGNVCSVEDVGCPASNCYCRCPMPQCEFWAYYHWQNGVWQLSGDGPAWDLVTDGTLVGWSWGAGNFLTGTVAPPALTFADVCQDVPSEPTTTPVTGPTATASAGTAPPQVTFEASTTTLVLGACAILTWVTWNAEGVTLNGNSVIGQGRQEACPSSTQKYTLVAANAAGQTMREITLVVAAPLPSASAEPVKSPGAPATAPAMVPTPATLFTATPGASVTGLPRTGTDLISPGPTGEAPAGAADALATAPVTPVVLPELPATRTIPRRTPGGGPTATPLLVAQGYASNEGESTMPDTGERTTGSRAQDTLIGLGAALLGAAVLLVTGWLIMRQRGASTTRR